MWQVQNPRQIKKKQTSNCYFPRAPADCQCLRPNVRGVSQSAAVLTTRGAPVLLTETVRLRGGLRAMLWMYCTGETPPSRTVMYSNQVHSQIRDQSHVYFLL